MFAFYEFMSQFCDVFKEMEESRLALKYKWLARSRVALESEKNVVQRSALKGEQS